MYLGIYVFMYLGIKKNYYVSIQLVSWWIGKKIITINHTLGKMVLSYLDACEQIEAGYYDWSPVNWNAAMLIAVKIDNKQLMEYFINKGANDWNDGMIIATVNGNKQLVEYFVSRGADDFNQGMCNAIQGGHKQLIEYFINRGANDWNNGILYAKYSRNIQLIEYFREKILDN